MRAGPGLNNNNNDNINEFMNQKCKFIMNSDLIKIKNLTKPFQNLINAKKRALKGMGL